MLSPLTDPSFLFILSLVTESAFFPAILASYLSNLGYADLPSYSR